MLSASAVEKGEGAHPAVNQFWLSNEKATISDALKCRQMPTQRTRVPPTDIDT